MNLADCEVGPVVDDDGNSLRTDHLVAPDFDALDRSVNTWLMSYPDAYIVRLSFFGFDRGGRPGGVGCHVLYRRRGRVGGARPAQPVAEPALPTAARAKEAADLLRRAADALEGRP